MHQYILGVYRLYEKLTGRFPEILFESCASGGSRFDPGLLYYAPQAWTSDDTDAVERCKIQYGTSLVPEILFESCASGGSRFDPGLLYYAPQAWTSDDTDAVERCKIQYGTSLVYPVSSMGSHVSAAVERCKIQYGTSLVYPVSSMGSHVSAVPNHQVLRNTSLKMRADVAYFGTFGYELNPNSLTEAEVSSMGSHVSAVPNHQVLRNTSLKMRADVAYFGTFGYELNPNSLTEAEREAIKKQTAFMKEHRSLIQYGTFYRLQSPFAGNEMAWMVVSEDKKEAIVGWYRMDGCV